MRLVETQDNPCPPGARPCGIVAADGVRLRAAFWPATGAPRGTVLICAGRTEQIEKYFELIGEFLARGYAACCFDWRGQGLSQRLLADPLKGHVARFADYELDLDAVMATVMADAPRPFVLFGHSMGGHVALRYLALRPDDFTRAILSAPMLDVRMPWLLRRVAPWAATAMCALGRGEAFARKDAGDGGLSAPFEGNTLTSDAGRYARNLAIVRAAPELGLGEPTWRWLAAAFASMRLVGRARFARSIVRPVMIVGAAHDRIVRQGADMRLIRRITRGLFVLFSRAEHELVQERDEVRRVFWRAADAFLDDDDQPSSLSS